MEKDRNSTSCEVDCSVCLLNACNSKETLEDGLWCCECLACACHRNNGLMVPLLGRYNLTLAGSRGSPQRCFLPGVSRSLSAVLAALASIVQSQWLFIYNSLCFLLEKKNYFQIIGKHRKNGM